MDSHLDQSRLFLVLGTSARLCSRALCRPGTLRRFLGGRNCVFHFSFRERLGVHTRQVEEKSCVTSLELAIRLLCYSFDDSSLRARMFSSNVSTSVLRTSCILLTRSMIF